MAPDPKEYEHLANKDRMLQGYPYDPYTDELVNERNKGKGLIREFNSTKDTELDKRDALLKELLHPDSKNSKIFIEPNFRVDYGGNITFGDNAYMNFDCCILDVCPVKIGKNFMAAPGVHIYTATHPIEVLERRVWEYGKPVTIGDDVWIGGMAVICPGVTIGNGVVVGAGSVVTKDVPEYTVVAGNPARVIKRVAKLEEDETLKRTNAYADPKTYEHLTHRERMTRGYPYNYLDEEIVREYARSRSLQKSFNSTDNNADREPILKELLNPNTGEGVYMRIGIKFYFGFNITMGKNGHCNHDLCILDIAPVVIGDNFMSGPSALIYTAVHPLDPVERSSGLFVGLPVKIGNDVWLGGKSIVCPGVTIGNGVTVGAGSVVTRDIPDNCVVAGRPAKIIKRLEK